MLLMVIMLVMVMVQLQATAAHQSPQAPAPSQMLLHTSAQSGPVLQQQQLWGRREG